MPRIDPLSPPYDPAIEALLTKWMPPGGALEPLRLFRTLAVHGDLMSRMFPLGAGILGHGRVAARDREIVIQRTCARAGAEYEWGVHAVVFAASVGLTEEQVLATAGGDASDIAWSDDDALLVLLADELHDTATLSDELWNALAERHHPDQLLELIAIAGWYRLLATVINAAEIELEPWAARFPSARAPGPRTQGPPTSRLS